MKRNRDYIERNKNLMKREKIKKRRRLSKI
jgi:hypothetical protein